MAYADYVRCLECEKKVVYYTGTAVVRCLCSDCYKKTLDMIADFLYAWDWWREDEYDRESPYDEVYQIKQHMQKLGYTIDKYGVTKVTK